MMEIINYRAVVLHHCLWERVVSLPPTHTHTPQMLKESVVIHYDCALSHLA